MGAPIVALESTVITHGLPHPQNLQLARDMEKQVRDNGATPATVALLDGKIRIGLSDQELVRLSESESTLKVSHRDFATAIVKKVDGGTTVAGTMYAANMAGIKVFATGGIGGVHRGAETSFDISADLQELAQTPVTVIAAGAKAILDLPKTWEVLETLGVPVIAYGQDELPAFWSRASGIRAPLRMDSPEQIAAAAAMRARLGLKGGQLVANPIPHDAEIARAEIMPVIEQALSDAETQGIAAKQVTPFLLQRIFELTGGRSLQSNISLVLNNARLAARIAIAMTR